MDFKVFVILLGLFDLERGASTPPEIRELTNENFKQSVMEKSHFVLFYSKR